jgi:hypothetical protein
LSERLGFFDKQEKPLVNEKIIEAEKVLNGLIKSLRND